MISLTNNFDPMENLENEVLKERLTISSKEEQAETSTVLPTPLPTEKELFLLLLEYDRISDEAKDEQTKLESKKLILDCSEKLALLGSKGFAFLEGGKVSEAVSSEANDLITVGMQSGRLKLIYRLIQVLAKEKTEKTFLIAETNDPKLKEQIEEDLKIIQVKLETLQQEEQKIKDHLIQSIPTLVVNGAANTCSVLLNQQLVKFTSELLSEVSNIAASVDTIGNVVGLVHNVRAAIITGKKYQADTKAYDQLLKYRHTLTDKERMGPKGVMVDAKMKRILSKVNEDIESVITKSVKVGTSAVGLGISGVNLFIVITGTALGASASAALSATGVGATVVGGVLAVYAGGSLAYKKRHDLRHGMTMVKGKTVIGGNMVANFVHQNKKQKQMTFMKQFEDLFNDVSLQLKTTLSLRHSFQPSYATHHPQQQDQLWKKQEEKVIKDCSVLIESMALTSKMINKEQDSTEKNLMQNEALEKEIDTSKEKRDFNNLVDKFSGMKPEEVKKLQKTVAESLSSEEGRKDTFDWMKQFGAKTSIPSELTNEKVMEFVLE